MANRSLVYELVSRLPPSILRWIGRAQFRSRPLRRAVEHARLKITDSNVLIRHGEAAGMWISPRQANPGYYFGTTEPDVQRFLAANLGAGQVFYDIGANVGFLTLVGARAVGSAGRVYSFEPLSEKVLALKYNVELNSLSQVKIVEAAVADRSGIAEFVAASPTGSHLAAEHEETDHPRLPVRVVSIDDIVYRCSFVPPHLVKIDVEGAEELVLAGMASVILNYRPIIICEIHDHMTARSMIVRMASAMVGSREESGYEVREAGPSPIAIIPRLEYQISSLEPGRSENTEMWAGHAVAMPLSGTAISAALR